VGGGRDRRRGEVAPETECGVAQRSKPVDYLFRAEYDHRRSWGYYLVLGLFLPPALGLPLKVALDLAFGLTFARGIPGTERLDSAKLNELESKMLSCMRKAA
jgi:hypothetical protein